MPFDHKNKKQFDKKTRKSFDTFYSNFSLFT